MGFQAAALTAARALDKPLHARDYAAQLPVLEALALEARRARVRSLDVLPEDARGKLLTVLLRVMRQPAVAEAEPEALRRKVYATLAEVFRTLGDERRAGLALAEAGEARAAGHLLAHAGEWEAVAALHEREGRHAEAARLFEKHERFAEAARLREAAGELEAALHLRLRLGDPAAVRAVAAKLPPERWKAVLLPLGLGDLLLELLAGAKRWDEIARLYERAEQWADAARAHERAGRTHKAIGLFDRSGERAEAERLIAAESEERAARGDAVGAAAVWARFGRPARAAELATDALHRHRFWLEAGEADKATLLAKREAREALAAGRPADAAPWLERLGETADAARAWLDGRQPRKAAALFETVEDWASAARAHEAAGDRARARELYARVGDEAGLARLAERAAGDRPPGAAGAGAEAPAGDGPGAPRGIP